MGRIGSDVVRSNTSLDATSETTKMKPTVVFVRVVTKPEYDHGATQWLRSYLRYRPQIDHDLVIINRYADPAMDDEFSVASAMAGAKWMRYDGGGWDCGAWQFAGANIESDLLVCFNSSTYVTGPGWLERFVEAARLCGDGLYGPLASYEIIPHIRTPCMAFQPHVIRDYPCPVLSREDTYRFEVFGFPGVPNFTQWVRQKGLATMLVTWDGFYDQPEWRTPPNIFRRGDQSNLIVKDRHCEAYEVSDAEGKRTLTGLADNLRA